MRPEVKRAVWRLCQRTPAAALDALAVAAPLRRLAARVHEDQGRLRAAARLLAADPSPYGLRLRELARAVDDGGLPLPPKSEPAAPDEPFNGRAVMALHGSPPFLNNGYAVRTLCLLDGIKAQGIACSAVTRPNFPHDLAAHRHRPVTASECVGGHTFHRLSSPAALWEGPLGAYVEAFADGLARLARDSGAGVIHAASNHVCGLAACLAAERTGARAVYELRGLWHWTTMHRRPGWEHTETFALHEALERQAALRAHRVVVLSEALAAHARGWGVEAARIVVAPNGVDTATFRPTPSDDGLRAAWGAGPETFVVGFVGSMTPYEGLDTLLNAVARLRGRGIDALAVLVGDGEDAASLQALAGRLGVPAAFPGRVPFAAVPGVLASMDCCPFPRRAEGAARLVPPLKLAEAMACAVPVAVADLPPLTEMVEHGRTGLVFGPGPDALAEALAVLHDDRAAARAMGRAAHAWAQERTWTMASRRVTAAWGA